MKPDSWEISRRGLVGGATCRKTPISQYTLEKNPMTRHLFEDNPVDEGTTKGALTPLCIVWKNPQVPHSAQQVACHSVNNSKGKRRSIPPQKTRRDSLVHTRQVACDPSQKWRGPLRFLPPFEMRPSSIAPNPVAHIQFTKIWTRLSN